MIGHEQRVFHVSPPKDSTTSYTKFPSTFAAYSKPAFTSTISRTRPSWKFCWPMRWILWGNRFSAFLINEASIILELIAPTFYRLAVQRQSILIHKLFTIFVVWCPPF